MKYTVTESPKNSGLPDAERMVPMPTQGKKEDILFLRWELSDPGTIAPIFSNRGRRGIYVLEFQDGSRYVGQSVDVVFRYITHRRGSSHHPGWEDVTAIRFQEIPEGDLNEPERAEIRRQQAENIPLRNRRFELHSVSPSPLDKLIRIEEQRHWSSGDPEACRSDFEALELRQRIRWGKFKNQAKKRKQMETYEKVRRDLAYALQNLIPNAIGTEARHWTLSDYPQTKSGRFATLNTGVIEFLAYPQITLEQHFSSPGTEKFLKGFEGSYAGFLNLFLPQSPLKENEQSLSHTKKGIPMIFRNHDYPLLSTEALFFPIGHLGEILDEDEDLLLDARDFALSMMKSRNSNLFRRFHSRDLTDDVYRLIKQQ